MTFEIEQIPTKCVSCLSDTHQVLYRVNLPSTCQECDGEIIICDQCIKVVISKLTSYIKNIS